MAGRKKEKKNRHIQRKPVTWRYKSLKEMDKLEIKYATQRLEEGWKAELPTKQLYTFTGLDEERIEEMKRRNPKLKELEDGYENYPRTFSRLNVAMDIYEDHDVQTSKWYLEHIDDDFKPASKIDVRSQQITYSVEDREEEINRLFEAFYESTKGSTVESDTDREVADREHTEPLQED